MGHRTGKEPDNTDTFLERICNALDLTPKELAKALNVDYKKDIKPLLATRSHVAGIYDDPVWYQINDYINKQMGYMMAIKTDLNRALQRDRNAKLLQREKAKAYHER